MDEDELLFIRVPLLQRQTNRAFGEPQRFAIRVFFKNLVACLELHRAVFPTLLKLWRTNTSAMFAALYPSEEPLITDVDTDNHGVEGIASDPCPVLLVALEQLRQMRLETITTGILVSVNAIIPIRELSELIEPKLLREAVFLDQRGLEREEIKTKLKTTAYILSRRNYVGRFSHF